MEVDTGSLYTLLPKPVWKKIERQFLKTGPALRDYNGGTIGVMGAGTVHVQNGTDVKDLSADFVDDPRASKFCGRQWFEAFGLLKVNHVGPAESSAVLKQLLEEYADLFDANTLGRINGFKAHMYVRPGAQFKLHKPRTVHFAMGPLFEAELQRLHDLNVIKRSRLLITQRLRSYQYVSQTVKSESAATSKLRSIVTSTCNSTHYLTSRKCLLNLGAVIDLQSSIFTTHICRPNSMKSCNHVVISTHRGLYRFKRLPFGVA